MKYIKLCLFVMMGIFILGCSNSSTKTSTSEDTPVVIEEPTVPEVTVTRVSCVGDSITAGTGISNPQKDSYPSQLAVMLGEHWEVKNFGVKSATLMKGGSLPYWNTSKYNPSHTFASNIVVIMLGTNDVKPHNWADHGKFVLDYTALIESYKNLSTQPTVYLCYPPPVYGEVAGITNKRVKNELIPLIQKVATANGVKIINIYSALNNKKALFPDKVHPNIDGARILAQTVAKAIR